MQVHPVRQLALLSNPASSGALQDNCEANANTMFSWGLMSQ